MRQRVWLTAILLATSAAVVAGCSAQRGNVENARVAAQQRELHYVVSKLDLHPMLKDFAKRRSFEAFADRELQIAESPLPDWRIAEIEERLAAWFRDPHTFATPLVGHYPDTRSLPVAFQWLSNGLVTVRTTQTPTSVVTGDKVLAISGVPTVAVARRLEELIGGDPIFVRHLGANELPAFPTLRALGLVQRGERVTLKLEREDGTRFTEDLGFRTQPGGALKAEEAGLYLFFANYELPKVHLEHAHRSADWAWYVTPRYGLFQLTSCIYDAAYQETVAAFFQQAADEHSPVVVLDLQQNGGGDSDAVIPWLEHLSPLVKASDVRLNTSRGYALALPPVQPIFTGRLYVLQSSGTFSSAMWLADALTGPGLGVRVGSTVGEPTAGYGNVAEYRTPVLNVFLQVSKQWYPTIKGKAEPTLPAQIPLDLTVADVQHGVNPVARWLATLH